MSPSPRLQISCYLTRIHSSLRRVEFILRWFTKMLWRIQRTIDGDMWLRWHIVCGPVWTRPVISSNQSPLVSHVYAEWMNEWMYEQTGVWLNHCSAAISLHSLSLFLRPNTMPDPIRSLAVPCRVRLVIGLARLRFTHRCRAVMGKIKSWGEKMWDLRMEFDLRFAHHFSLPRWCMANPERASEMCGPRISVSGYRVQTMGGR